ncbi:MAG: MFS transporter [Coriobacteriia bacterium]|nr:MFS transporter [Coriobacteriia bacterium]
MVRRDLNPLQDPQVYEDASVPQETSHTSEPFRKDKVSRLDETVAADILATSSLSDHDDKGAWGRLAKNPNFRKMWIAQFVTGLGDWLIIGILMPLVTALSGGSSFAVAGILIAKILPSLLLSSFVGVFVDYFDRRKIMIVTDLIRVVLTLILLTTNSLAAIYMVVFLMEVVALFFWPARNSLIPHLVDESDVSVANSFMYTTQQASMIVGLAASGAILAGFSALVNVIFDIAHLLPTMTHSFIDALVPMFVGAKAGYILNALTFMFSAFMIHRVGGLEGKTAPAEKKLDLSVVKDDALESFRFITSHEELRGLLVTVFFAVVGGGAIVPVGLDHIAAMQGVIPGADHIEWLATFSGSRQTFVMTFLAIGMAIGAILIPRIEKKIPVRIFFPVSALFVAFGMIGFALTNQYFVACLYAIAAGFFVASLTVGGNNYIVQEVDDSIRGRVFTALESVIRVSLLVSMIVIAPLSDIVGGAMRQFLEYEGVTTFFGLPMTGARITLVLSACIVFAAGLYGFKKLYWEKRDELVSAT